MHILKQCFPRATKFQIKENAANEGPQSYFSAVIRLTADVEEEGSQRRKFLVLKVPNTCDVTSFSDDFDLFGRETFVYEVLIPRLNNYSAEALTPSYLKTVDSKIIVLEDLVARGYEGQGNPQLCNLRQSLFVVRALANFHASSYKVVLTDRQLAENEILNRYALLEIRRESCKFWKPVFRELLTNQKSRLSSGTATERNLASSANGRRRIEAVRPEL